LRSTYIIKYRYFCMGALLALGKFVYVLSSVKPLTVCTEIFPKGDFLREFSGSRRLSVGGLRVKITALRLLKSITEKRISEATIMKTFGNSCFKTFGYRSWPHPHRIVVLSNLTITVLCNKFIETSHNIY
jgi:hypothetical protein